MKKTVAMLAILGLVLGTPYFLLTYLLYRVDVELGNPRPKSRVEMEKLVARPSWSATEAVTGDRWNDYKISGWGLIAYGYPPGANGSVIWAYGMPSVAAYLACTVRPVDNYQRAIAFLVWDSCELRDMTA